MCRDIFPVCYALVYLGQLIDAKPQFQPVKMAAVCKNETYCTRKGDDYPEQIIESLLMGIKDKWQEIVNATIPGHRQSIPNNECKYKSMTGEIYTMLDSKGNLRYVAQNTKWFNQRIRIEKCVNPGPVKDATNSLSKTDVYNNEFECKQSYLDYQFVVLSLDGTKLEPAKMKNGVPVCCACVLINRKKK